MQTLHRGSRPGDNQLASPRATLRVLSPEHPELQGSGPGVFIQPPPPPPPPPLPTPGCMLGVDIGRFLGSFHATNLPQPAQVGTKRELP